MIGEILLHSGEGGAARRGAASAPAANSAHKAKLQYCLPVCMFVCGGSDKISEQRHFEPVIYLLLGLHNLLDGVKENVRKRQD